MSFWYILGAILGTLYGLAIAVAGALFSVLLVLGPIAIVAGAAYVIWLVIRDHG